MTALPGLQTVLETATEAIWGEEQSAVGKCGIDP